jgi:hypothetical protein
VPHADISQVSFVVFIRFNLIQEWLDNFFSFVDVCTRGYLQLSNNHKRLKLLLTHIYFFTLTRLLLLLRVGSRPYLSKLIDARGCWYWNEQTDLVFFCRFRS